MNTIETFALPSDELGPINMGSWPFKFRFDFKHWKQMNSTTKKDECKSIKKMKKMDLIRITALYLHNLKKEFVSQDIQDQLQGVIDKQTISAMINRLYSTNEIISRNKNDEGRIVYKVNKLRDLPKSFESMSIDEAIEYYIKQDLDILEQNAEQEKEDMYFYSCK